MKRITVTAILVMALILPMSAVSGHEVTEWDAKNKTTNIDVQRAWFDHNDNKILGRIQTYDGVSNKVLRTRGFFRFHIWRAGEGDDGVFAVAIYHTQQGFKARIFKLRKNRDPKHIAMGQAKRDAADEFSFSFPRSKVGLGGKERIKWTVFGFWCPDKDCESPEIDWLPQEGALGHRLT